MRTVVDITEANIYGFLQNLGHGVNLGTCCDAFVTQKLDKCLGFLNGVYGAGAVEKSPYINIDLDGKGGYTERPEENVFQIVCRVREGFGLLKGTDFNLMDLAIEASDDRKVITLDIYDEKVISYARKIAKSLGIRLVLNRSGKYMFNGESSSLSVSKQIQQAYSAGRESISFSLTEVNPTTVRCYASNLSSMFSKKFRCSISPGLITIYFKELDKTQELLSKLERLKSEYVPIIGEIDFWETFENFIIFGQKGTDPETYNDQEKEVENVPTRRKVDGLNQFYIPELEGMSLEEKKEIAASLYEEEEEDDF